MRVRDVTLADVPAICEVHRGSDGPWTDLVECAIVVNHRLIRPFHCRVLEREGQVVGHAEWIIDQQPHQTTPVLYLGLLQVHSDWQGKGFGKALVEDGHQLARKHGCRTLRTVPDDDAVGFYDRCNFTESAVALSYRLDTRATDPPKGWRQARLVPARVSQNLPMRLGRVQASSAHMWEICNRPVLLAGDTWQHPCLKVDRGSAYVQIRYRDASQALIVAWADLQVPLQELLEAAQVLAGQRQVDSLLIAVDPQEELETCGEPAGTIPVYESTVRDLHTDR